MSRVHRKPAFHTGVVIALSGGVICTSAALGIDNSYVPASGGFWDVPGNWSLGHCPLVNEDVKILVSGNSNKAVDYNWSGSTGFNSLTVDGSGAGYYGAIWHLEGSIVTDNMYLGDNGPAWHWMESDAFLWSLGNLYVGYDDPGIGHFYLAGTDYGVLVNGDSYVGYSGEGDFDHYNGYHACEHVFVGQNAPGTYWLRGPTATSTLLPEYYMVVGNADEGLFEQTGGTFGEIGGDAVVYLGLNTGGEGTYNMKGGVLNAHHISIAWNGDGYLNVTGGTLNIANDVNIGCDGTHPYRAWVKVTDTDDEPTFNIGGDLKIGPQTLAKYEQTGSGTVEVTGNIEIWQGTTDPYDYSYLYMGLNADWLGAGAVINHSGYFDQDGGTLNTYSFTNDSTQGINLDNNADTRIRYLTNNAGTAYMWRNALLRGTHAGGGAYYLCNFTNNATFQMGNAGFDGGTFFGILTNYGTFDYYQGDFTQSKMINHGTCNLHNDFSCAQFVNNAYSMTIPTGRWINATGENAPNAFENNGNLTMKPSSHVNVGNYSKFVNNDNMYAGGPGSSYAHIYGDVENYDYLLPCDSGLPSGQLYVNGDFSAFTGAELRIRIHGTGVEDCDFLAIQGTANLGGRLDVRLTGGFVPDLSDSFSIVGYSARTGTFNPVYLPDLPNDWEWEVTYDTNSVVLTVVEPQEDCPEDVNNDNVVDIDDIFAVLAAWGTCNDCPEDVNDDGYVDIDDIFAVLAAWGPC